MKTDTSSGDRIAPDVSNTGDRARDVPVDAIGTTRHQADESPTPNGNKNHHVVEENAYDNIHAVVEEIPDRTVVAALHPATKQIGLKACRDKPGADDWETVERRTVRFASPVRNPPQEAKTEQEPTALAGDSGEGTTIGDESNSEVPKRSWWRIWTCIKRSETRNGIAHKPATADRKAQDRRHRLRRRVSGREVKIGVDSSAIEEDQSHNRGKGVAEAPRVDASLSGLVEGETAEGSEESAGGVSEAVMVPRPSALSSEPVEEATPGGVTNNHEKKESRRITIRPTRMLSHRSRDSPPRFRWLELTFPPNSGRLAEEYCAELNRRFKNYIPSCPVPHRPDTRPGSGAAAVTVMVPVSVDAELVSEGGPTAALRFRHEWRAAQFRHFALLFTPLDANTLIIRPKEVDEYRERLACKGSSMEHHFEIQPRRIPKDVLRIPWAFIFKTNGRKTIRLT